VSTNGRSDTKRVYKSRSDRPARIGPVRQDAFLFLLFFILFCTKSFASAALFLEEPYGRFGGMNPTGHSAIYLDHICADSPTSLRLCAPGETGVVLSRYHKVAGYDWLAMPLLPYLYGVESASEIPESVTPASVARIRDTYRHEHLQLIAADRPDGSIPPGEWTELVGSAFDRKIYVYQVATTREQDEHLIASFNDRKNVAHYNIFDRNCADFSRNLFNLIYPDSVHRNLFADWGIMTPKQVARTLVSYGRQHPEADLRLFVIPQVSGTVPRSHPIYGCTEGFIKSKKYAIPAILINPYIDAGMLAVYVVDGRFSPPHHPDVLPVVAGFEETSHGARPADSSGGSGSPSGDSSKALVGSELGQDFR